ncbi:MAG: hypothetical protein COA42_08205 [Alteromonadaceae bacterium]|nr:MAG: hypothetical protein COA42_08205 [Alteromonadaceae bacterium]
MNLDKICIVPRVRGAWEAIDLGIMLAKAWYRDLFLLWFLPALPLFLILLIALPSEWSKLAAFAVWWFKPLWDRGPLHYASLKLFGDNISVSAAMRKLPSIYKIDILSSITWRRLSFARSFNMPVTLLERLTGKARSQRLGILHRDPSSASSWLTITLLFVELFLYAAVLTFLFVMVPNYSPINIAELFNSQDGYLNIGSTILLFSAMAAVAPFYTAAGFALYINRRMALEGWDIEIRFRQLAENQGKLSAKTSSKSGITTSAPSLLLCLFTCFSLWSFDSNAGSDITLIEDSPFEQTTDTPEKITHIHNAKDAEKLITEILAGEVFHNESTVSGWRFKDFPPEEEIDESPEWLIAFLKSLADFFSSFDGQFSSLAGIVEFFIWVLAIGFVIFIIYHYRHALNATITSISTKRIQTNNTPPPKELFGLDLREESLPEDIPSEVRSLWQKDEHRAALSLLYRASLYKLIHEWGFNFSEGDTEGDCAKLVTLQGDASLSDYTKHLTQCWQLVAYAHRSPENDAVEKLCQQWSSLFEKPTVEQPGASHNV